MTAVDQFNDLQVYRLKEPTNLYTPVDKNDEGIKNPATSLLCYDVKPVRGICVDKAPTHQGAECETEDDCGGTQKVTNFCEFEPKGHKVPDIFVNN